MGLHRSEYVWRPAFELIFNITCGMGQHIEAIVGCGLLPALLERLTCQDRQGQVTKHDAVVDAVCSIVHNLVLAPGLQRDDSANIRADAVDEVITCGLAHHISRIALSTASTGGM